MIMLDNDENGITEGDKWKIELIPSKYTLKIGRLKEVSEMHHKK